MAKRPTTAEELIWKVVRDSRWRGAISPPLVNDVLTVYTQVPVLFVEKLGSASLRVQIDERDLDAFRDAFPEAERDVRYAAQAGTVMLRLPIPERERRPVE
jgi:hypothetical protein